MYSSTVSYNCIRQKKFISDRTFGYSLVELASHENILLSLTASSYPPTAWPTALPSYTWNASLPSTISTMTHFHSTLPSTLRVWQHRHTFASTLQEKCYPSSHLPSSSSTIPYWHNVYRITELSRALSNIIFQIYRPPCDRIRTSSDKLSCPPTTVQE